MLSKPTWSNLRILGLALGFTAYGLPTQAEERLLTAELDWTAPPASRCPTAEKIVRAVETRLARTVFVQGTRADVRLTVKLEPIGSTWSAKLELLDAQQTTLGTRYLKSASSNCAALSDVLPVVIALLVDASRPSVRLDLPEPSYQPPAIPPEATASDQREEDVVSEPHNRPLSMGWVARTEAIYGLLPGVALGVGLVGFVEPAGLDMPIEFWLGALTPAIGHRESDLRLSLVYAGLGLCPSLWRRSLDWTLCAGMTIGDMQSFGRGFDVNQSATSLYLDARAATVLDVPIARPWFARLEAGAVFPLIRRRFVAEAEPGTQMVLHRPSAIAPEVAVGVGVRFQ